LHFFPRLAQFECFSALGAGGMFSRSLRDFGTDHILFVLFPAEIEKELIDLCFVYDF